MVRVLSVGIDLATTAVAFMPLIFIWQRVFLKTAWLRTWLLFLFVLYLAAVCSLVGIPSVNGLVFDASTNLIPIADIATGALDYARNSLLNVLLFVPLGVFAPLLWGKFRSIKRVGLLAACLSCAIELSQLLTFRVTDIDDVITNTMGAILGYLLLKGLTRNKGILAIDAAVGGAADGLGELLALIGATVLWMFFAQPFVGGWVWDIFYTMAA